MYMKFLYQDMGVAALSPVLPPSELEGVRCGLPGLIAE